MAEELSDDDYAGIEQAAYEAAVVPELWPKVLERVGEISGSAGAAFCCVSERGVNIVCAPRLQAAADTVIREGYMSRSGRAQGVIERGLVGVPRFLNEHDYYASLADADADPIVTEVFRKEGFGWAAGWLLDLPHGDLLIMNVEQFHERGPIEGEALARLDSLYAIFARAATLGARVGFERVRTAIETLTALGLAAAAVTPTGRVVLANDEFNAAADVWTTRGLDRVALNDRVADQMLADALAALKLARSPRSIPVRAVAGGPVVAVVQVVPIRRSAADVFGGADAILVLSEPKPDKSAATLIHSLYDLTPAEIEVARDIAAGFSIAAIAARRRKSVATVRNQLKHAMAKTGTSRQLELALLVRQLGG